MTLREQSIKLMLEARLLLSKKRLGTEFLESNLLMVVNMNLISLSVTARRTLRLEENTNGLLTPTQLLVNMIQRVQ